MLIKIATFSCEIDVLKIRVFALGGVHMSPPNRAGPVCRAEISPLGISAFLTNTLKIQQPVI